MHVTRWDGRLAMAAVSLAAFTAVPITMQPLRAQDIANVAPALAPRGPRFLLRAERGRPTPIDAERTPILREHIALDLDGVSLDEALATIARKAGIRLVYSGAALDLGKRVSFRVERISVAAALTEMLLDAHVDVLFARSGRQAAIVNRAPAVRAAVLTGRVSDAKTHAPVAGAQVMVEGTRLVRLTDDSGRYTIPDVPAGAQRVTARRLGYAALTLSVTVADGGTATLDFALAPAAMALDEIVTTATGDQRRRQVGNVIEMIPVDSLVATAPVTNLADAIAGRAAGVQVFFNGGLTGASPQVNIRGQNSLSLSNQPLLIVDGVRVENSTAGVIAGPTFAAARSGRFNDIPLADIESIEIVKGPSAATLYGTDAANGVIVIRTKRGTAGPPRWEAFAEGGIVTFDRNRFAPSVYPWGHLATGTPTPTRCPLLSVVAGVCVQDSITQFSPLRNPETTPIGSGQRMAYGIQTSGGQEVRYFLSASMEDEVGYLKMPAADADLLRAQRGGGGFSEEERHPNAVRKYGLRANLTVPITQAADLAFSSAIVQQRSRIPNPITLTHGAASTGTRDENDGWFFGMRPGDDFVKRHREDVTHFMTSVAGTWRPATWLDARLTGGLDFSSSYLDELARAGEGFLPRTTAGARSNTKTNVTVQTMDAGLTATAPLAHAITSRTSAGVQYTRRTLLTSTAAAERLAPGSETVTGGAVPIVRESTAESIVAGTYLEETMGLRNRLFLTGAVRVDGSSSFGKGFRAAMYPKASLSWTVSEEPFWPKIPGLVSLRLRAAYGQSGVEPDAAAALATEQLFPAFVDGAAVIGGGLGSIGNENLKPERQREVEAGLDAEMLGGRLAITATYYDKRSTDALVNLPLPASFGSGTRWENVGSVRNWGYEASVRAVLLSRRTVRWDVQLNGSVNENEVVTIGPGVTAQYGVAGPGIVEGKPLFSYFEYPIVGYADSNGNGIIEVSEVTVGDTRAFAGRAYPRVQVSAGTTVGLLGDDLQLSATVDHRGGFSIFNFIDAFNCVFDACAGAADPDAPLARQAATVAAKSGQLRNTFWGFVEDGSFTRLREVSLTYRLPESIASLARARSARLTLSGRNLALWTRYSGADPEVQSQLGRSNRGAYYDEGGLPPATYWLLKLDLGF